MGMNSPRRLPSVWPFSQPWHGDWGRIAAGYLVHQPPAVYCHIVCHSTVLSPWPLPSSNACIKPMLAAHGRISSHWGKEPSKVLSVHWKLWQQCHSTVSPFHLAPVFLGQHSSPGWYLIGVIIGILPINSGENLFAVESEWLRQSRE